MGCGKSTQRGVEQCVHEGVANAGNSKLDQKTVEKKIAPSKLTILVLGGPGSGRATLCYRMSEEYDFVHLSVGKMLREEVKKGSPIGQKTEALMIEGRIIPSDVQLKLLNDAIASNSKSSFILIDGFPCTLDQAKSFLNQVCQPDMVIYLECPIDKMEERLLLRAESSERLDDNSETITRRLETFRRESLPVIAHFEQTFPHGRFKKVKGALEKVEVFLEIASILKETYGLEARSVLAHKRHDCSKKTNLLILGGPGSGKGTQCKFTVRDFGYTHISTGDLLRNEVQSGTTIGKEVDRLMKEGQLVPMNVTITLLENAMNKAGCKHFLIDGFPRSVEQARAFEEKVGKPDMVIYFKCSNGTMEKRLLERGKVSKRADDNSETIKKRFEAFQKESKPVVEYYKTMSNNVLQEVSAENDPESVYKQVKEILLKTVEKET